MNKENPYAFPQTEFNDKCHPDFNGMMLRDYFAAKAMQGYIASEYGAALHGNEEGKDAHAKMFYSMADAMLKARES